MIKWRWNNNNEDENNRDEDENNYNQDVTNWFIVDVPREKRRVADEDDADAYMQKTCDVAEKATLAKKNLRKKCVNRDKM